MIEKMKPVHFLKGISFFTQDELEKRLLNDNINKYINKNNSANNLVLFFDLSQVRWAYLSAAFQLCLVIEKLKKNNYKIYIALPYTIYSESISKSMPKELRERHRNQRKDAKEFLRNIAFDKALLCEHIINKHDIVLSDRYKFSSGEINLDYFIEIFSSTNEYKPKADEYSSFNVNTYPLTWLTKDEIDLDGIAKKIKFTLSKGNELQVHHIDLLSLKNVVLYELFKNLQEHAGNNTNHALFAIGLISSSSIKKRTNSKKYYSSEVEQNFVEGIKDGDIESLIELYFGDTGVGICSDNLLHKFNSLHVSSLKTDNKSDQKDLLKWSFDKWSTSKDEDIRGTKGLYRIHRIVNKYNGIVHVRTKKIDGGYQKGGNLTSSWIENKEEFYLHPGTFVQIKLCPQKEIMKFNLVTNVKQNYRKKWSVEIYSIDSNFDIGLFKKWFKSIISSDQLDNLIIVFYSETNNEKQFSKYLEQIFLEVSKLRGFKGTVLYVAASIGKNTLETSVNSSNESIIRIRLSNPQDDHMSSDNEHIYDPILVIGEDNSISWFGGNQNIINILSEIYAQPNNYPKSIMKLDSFINLNDDDQIEILKYFQNESSFFTISKNEQINFDFTNILALYRDKLNDSIEKTKKSERRLCSPKLNIIDKWINFTEILNSRDSLGLALALYSILSKEKKIHANKTDITIFIDHNQNLKLALDLARLLGVKEKKIINLSEDVDFELPKRTKLFNENDDVLILTTIISSSETIRKLVKHVLRDNANVLAIASLINNKEGEKSNILRTWDQTTNIYSIINNDEDEKTITQDFHEKHDLKIKELHNSLKESPIVYSPKFEVSDKELQYGIDDELKEFFEETKALYYNHFGKYYNRHFTFFLHKNKILKDKKLAKNLSNEIQDWYDKVEEKYKLDKLVIVIPNTNSENLKSCIALFKLHDIDYNIKLLDSYIEEDIIPNNLVFFDFGSLTGKTIKKILTSNPCKCNLLILTIFNQLKGEDKYLFGKIIKIKCEVFEKQEEEDIQMDIFSNIDGRKKESVINTEEINVSYKYLYDLPYFFYRSIDCPICQHIEALDKYKVKKSNYLKAFSENRKLLLKTIHSNNIPPVPTDHNYVHGNHEDHELSNTLICNMYYIKDLLEKAHSYTESRIDLFRKLFGIYKDIDTQLKNQSSELYALLFFLSSEIIWLQKEPLIFRNFRYIVYSLSKKIATFDITQLTKIFSGHTDVTNTQAFNFATRYKYAAISVFRSSDKFHFCKNIYDIIASSKHNEVIGDSIFQNTMFHINSIHLNQYNESYIYFTDTDEQLNLILENEKNLTNEQEDAIKILKFNNEKYKRERKLKNMTQVELFMNLQREINEVYPPDRLSHHSIDIDFASLRIDFEIDILEDVVEFRKQSLGYKPFKNIESSLIENYDKIKSYLSFIVIPHINAIDSLQNNILQSVSYLSLKQRYYKYLKISKAFEDYIEKGSEDIFHILDSKDEFIEWHNLIYTTFIKYNTKVYNLNNASLFNFLASIPTDLLSVVEKAFSDQNFKAVNNNIPKNIEVFACSNMLERELKLILGNIRKRQNCNYGVNEKNINNSLENCIINFNCRFEGKYVFLTITYSNTELFPVNQNNHGNLYQFKKELVCFDGDLFHKKLQNNDYWIEIKLLNMEVTND